MTRKIYNLFLVFICLFLFSFSSVRAEETSTLIVDFPSLEDTYDDYYITDHDSGRVFHKFELFEWIIDNYSSKYNFMIFPYATPTNEDVDFIIYQCISNYNYNFYITFNSPNVYNLRLDGEWHAAWYNVTVWNGSGDGISSNFSLSQLKNSLDDLFSNPTTDNSTLIEPWFWSPDFSVIGGSNSFFPYYSNIKGHFSSYDANSDLVINAFHSRVNQIIISKDDDISGFFYSSDAKVVDENAPVPNVSFSNVITDDNDIVTGVTATIDFSDFNGSYRNKYSFNDNEVTIDNKTIFSITSNGTLRARSCSKSDNICYNKKSYNIDFIGRNKKYFDDFMDEVYKNDLLGDEPKLSATSSIDEYLNWYFYHFKKTYTIIFQIRDLIDLFNINKNPGIHDNQPLPAFNINLGFLGINQSFNVFDLSPILPYKDTIYNLIKYICAIYTFITCIDLVKELTKNS